MTKLEIAEELVELRRTINSKRARGNIDDVFALLTRIARVVEAVNGVEFPLPANEAGTNWAEEDDGA